jgi:hypothetical protein
MMDGWPIQARFWLEWDISTAGLSLPAARSRFRVIYPQPIFIFPSRSYLLAFELSPNLHTLNFAKNAKVYDGRVAHSSPLLA